MTLMLERPIQKGKTGLPDVIVQTLSFARLVNSALSIAAILLDHVSSMWGLIQRS